MRRRAMGMETEYGVSVTPPEPQDSFDPYELWSAGQYPSQFLRNGARRYVDGSHPEYATPECDNGEEVVRHGLAGDRILTADLQAHYLDRHQQGLPPIAVSLVRNHVTPRKNFSYGMHENYQARRPKEGLKSYAAPLLPFLVTRQLLFGTGLAFLGPKNLLQFGLSQRAQFFHESIGGSSTGVGQHYRPLFNTRDEPYSTQATLRLHIICGDQPFLPQLMALQLDMMDALLLLIEEHRLGEYPRLVGFPGVFKAVSRNPTSRIHTTNPSLRSALDIQRWYFEQIWRVVSRDSGLAGHCHRVAPAGHLLDRLADSLAAEDHVGHLAWATKQALITDYYGRRGNLTDDDLYRVDSSFHQICGPRASMLGTMLQRYGSYDEPAVELAMTTPPQNTRAKVRGAAVDHPGLVVIDWDTVKRGSQLSDVTLSQPLNASVPRSLAGYLA